MAALRIPNELIISILDDAQYDDLLPRYKWLKAYSRVCRTWRSYAQQLLFTDVALVRGAAQCKAFMDTVTSTAEPERMAFLRGCVRTLSVVVDHQTIYTEIIELCPNLRELHLSLFHASFRSEALASLERGPRVEALRIRAFYCKPILQLLSVYDKVHFLEVDFNSVRDETSITLEDWPVPLAELKELRFTATQRPPHPFLSWALSGSPQSMEVLHVCCPGLQVAALAESGVGPSLRSFSMPASFGCTTDLAAFAPSLQEAEFGMPLSSYILSPNLFDRLPLGLVHLSLRDSDGIGQHCVRYIDSLAAYYDRAEGSLRVLSYHCRTGDVERLVDVLPAARALFDFCRARNVEFRLFEPPYGHYARENIPLGPVHAFPRPMPLSERRSITVDEDWFNMASARGMKSKPKKILRKFAKAFGSSIPPVALAKP
ncbi:hypothetical protein BC628DRAFT_1408379 [Trametes gibbosa]|nr:hypothetical protein BC628DRAFT_1408379 [Trametes gibbosa]